MNTNKQPRKKVQRNPSALPREPLESGHKSCTFKIGPTHLNIMSTVCDRRRITKAKFMREAIEGMEGKG